MLATLIRKIILCSFVTSLCLRLPAQNSEKIETADQVIRYFQSTEQPMLELMLEEEPEGSACRIQIYRYLEDGSRESLMLPLPLKSESAVSEKAELWSGETLCQGKPVLVELKIQAQRTQMEWLSPDVLSMTPQPLRIAGTYGIVSGERRLERAKAAFAKADARLNAVYAALKNQLSPDRLEEVKIEQRRWLKYRDHVLIDGDNGWLIGPSSTSHYQQQTERTLARIAYLKALADAPARVADGDGSGYYVDGFNRTLSFQQIYEQKVNPTGLYFFSFSSPSLEWQETEFNGPVSLAGVCNASGKKVWGTGESYLMYAAGEPKLEAPEEIELRNRHGVLYVNQSGDGTFIGNYVRIRNLAPADIPILHVLYHFPMELFDHTTEGIAADDMEHLPVDGSADLYKIQKVTPNYLKVGYTGGTVELRRYPMTANGGALIAALTTNGRSRTLEFWQLKALHSPPSRMESQQLLPEFSWKDFRDSSFSSSITESLVLDYELDESSSDMVVRALPVNADDVADAAQTLLWDGYGFIKRRLD